MHYYSVKIIFIAKDLGSNHSVWHRHFTDVPTKEDVERIADYEHGHEQDEHLSALALRVLELTRYAGIPASTSNEDVTTKVVRLAGVEIATIVVTPIKVVCNQKAMAARPAYVGEPEPFPCPPLPCDPFEESL